MAIPDREDRAAATKSQVAARERKKKTKIKVKPPKVGASSSSGAVRTPDVMRPEEKREVVREIKKNERERMRRKIPTLTSAKTPRPPRMTRDQEFALAVEAFMGREPSFKKSADKTRLSSFARNWVLGPAISEPGFDPSNPWEYFDAAVLLPFGRPIAGARAGIKGGARLASGKGRHEAAAVARAEYAGPGLTNRGVRAIGRRVKPKQVRTWAEQNLRVSAPAAAGAIPRFLGDVVESQRDNISKATFGKGFRSTRKKITKEVETRERFLTKLLETPGVELKHVGSKLTLPEQYAIRLVAEGQLPEEQILFEMAKAGEQSGARKISHLMHADLFRAASKFVQEDPAGGLTFRDDAPEALRRAWELAEQTAGAREDIYETLGLLAPEQMELRVQAIGKQIKGTNWQKSTLGQLEALKATEGRQKLLGAVTDLFGATEARANLDELKTRRGVAEAEGRIGDAISIGKEISNLNRVLEQAEARANDFMALADARALAKESFRKSVFADEALELENVPNLTPDQAARLEAARKALEETPDPELYYGRLHDVVVGIPPNAREQLARSRARGAVAPEPDPSIKPPRAEIEAIADDILGQDLKLPPEIADREGLANAISTVYDLALDGVEGRFWYDNAASQVMRVADHFGITPQQSGQLFAIYSQAADTIANATFVIKATKQYLHYADIYAGRFPERQGEEALAVMKGEAWEGRKRSAFYQNMIESLGRLYPGSVDPSELSGKPVTVDRWVVRMFAPELKRDVPAQYYDALEQLTQQMAARMGWEPKELQAAAWVSAKAKGLGDSKRKGARHKAGAKDAFEYGVDRNLVQGELFDAAPTHPDVLRAINAVRKPDGGATLYADLTNAEPTGFIVAYGPHELSVSPGKISPRDLELYRDAHRKVLDDKKTYGVGLWHDPETGLVNLDVVREFKGKAQAIRWGREQGQVEIFDAQKFDSVPTGLTHEEARAIKSRLKKESGAGRMIPPELRKKEVLEARDPYLVAKEEYDKTLGDIADKMGWGRSQGSREAVENLAYENALRAPDEPWAKSFLELARKAHEGPDLDEVFGPDPRAAQGVDLLGSEGGTGAPGGVGDSGRVLGLYESTKGTKGRRRGGKISIDPDSGEPAGILHHELAHFHEDIHLGPEERRLFQQETGVLLSSYEGAELFARMAEDWLLAGMDGRVPNIPEGLQGVFRRMSEVVAAEYKERGHLRRVRRVLPESVTDLFDTMHWYDEISGGGKLRAPYRRGLPANLRTPFRSVRAIAHASAGKFGGGRKSSIGRGAVDPTVTKAFRGVLKDSGLWKGDVTTPLAEDLFKAVKVESVYRLRSEFLKASKAIPENVDDVPIKVDPKIDAPPALRQLLDLFDDFEIGTKRSTKELEGMEMQAVEDMIEHLFPDVLQGSDPRYVAMQLLEEELTEPIDNIRWIPREMFEGSDMLNSPTAMAARVQGWNKLETGGLVVDAFNDLMKSQLLLLNLPPYITMNFLGNLSMNLFQQGFYALMNVPRAALLSRSLGGETARGIDHVMGSGFSRQVDLRTPVKWALNPLNTAISKLVDMVPRRAAFLHEAWKLGYRSDEDIVRLLKSAKPGEAFDQAVQDDLYYIWRKAQDAIIDYENLGPIEKKYITRILFIYPWIKGATKYTARFPAEHPYQALAMALLYDRQQSMADEELGERPWYADLDIPIGTVERYGEERPYTINPKQLLPQTTPYEFGKSIYGFATGADEQPLIETLSPFLSNLATALSGKRAFDNSDVDRDAGTFLSESDPRNGPLVKRIQELFFTSEQDRIDRAPNKLYPRNYFDEVLKGVFGSLAPKPYSPEKGQWMASGERGKEPQQEKKEKLKEFEDTFGLPAPPEIVDAYDSKVEWKLLLADAHQEKSDLSDEELVELKLELLLKRKPQFAGVKDAARKGIRGSEAERSAIQSWIERELGWNDLEAITEAKNKKRKAAA